VGLINQAPTRNEQYSDINTKAGLMNQASAKDKLYPYIKKGGFDESSPCKNIGSNELDPYIKKKI
jgi:hypothetical protein